MAKRYGLVIDLERCVGCNACTISCLQANGSAIPAGECRTSIKVIESGSYPALSTVFRKTACMHCADAPCIEACPEQAISKSPEGITLIDKNLCTSCEACVETCPYHARVLNTADMNNDKVDACDFCSERLARGEQPACTVNCVARALTFGDLNDPGSEVAKKASLARPLLAGLNSNPAVLYIPPRKGDWDVV